MKVWGLIFCFAMVSLVATAQQFDLPDIQDSYQTTVGETLRIPIKITNQSDKPLFYIIRRAQSDLGESQKGISASIKIASKPGSQNFRSELNQVKPFSNWLLFWKVV
jgi:hypothetical protein